MSESERERERERVRVRVRVRERERERERLTSVVSGGQLSGGGSRGIYKNI